MNRINKKLLKRIIAVVLCITLIVSLVVVNRLADISAIENTTNGTVSGGDAIIEDVDTTDEDTLTENISEDTVLDETLENEVSSESDGSKDTENREDEEINNEVFEQPEENKFTWRETTAERHVYVGARDLIGKIYCGETIEEIFQMIEDPSVEVDEENFFKTTCFEGLTMDDLKVLQANGYTLEELGDLASNAGVGHIRYVFDMSILEKANDIPKISTYSSIANALSLPVINISDILATQTYSSDIMTLAGARNATVTWVSTPFDIYLPSLDMPAGSLGEPPGVPIETKPWYLMNIGGKPAFCIDPGNRMTKQKVLTQQEEPYTGQNATEFKKAIKWMENTTMDSITAREYAQLYIWCHQRWESQEEYVIKSYFCSVIIELWTCKNNQDEILYNSTWTTSDFFQAKNALAAYYGGGNEAYLTYNAIAGTNVSGANDFDIYLYDSGDPAYQRLITTKVTPPGDVIPENPSSQTDAEVFRSRVYVKHNINGEIDGQGKGVMGSWQGFSGDVETWICVCGDLETNCPHGTETITFYEYIESENPNPSLLTALSEQHYFTSKNTTYTPSTYLPVEPPTTPVPGVVTPTDPILDVIGHYEHTDIYTTYSDHYHEPGGQDIIPDPVVSNFTLTLNYQGGYYTGGAPSTTSMGNNFVNNATSFSGTRKNVGGNNSWLDGIHAENQTSYETTNVQFVEMHITGTYKLNSQSEAGGWSAGSLSGNTFTHENDGVAALVEMSYTNYYLCGLPTPVRPGYNFLGWFTSPTGGTKVNPITVSPDGNTYTDVCVMTSNKTLYAHWELITKDETFTIQWLDNNNNYTTRPSAVYVELYRYSGSDQAELCQGYISELLNTTSSDWINNFSNETGINNHGNASASSNKTSTIFDPNVYLDTSSTPNTYNNVYSAKNTFMIKVDPTGINNTGVYNNPASGIPNPNTWTFTLKNLQKFNTTNDSWNEYTYVIKAITVESLDDTTQYYVSGNAGHNSYSTALGNYYNITNYTANNSGQMTHYQYDSTNVRSYFSNTIVNRAMNVAGPNNWKDIVVSATFKDGPVDNFDDDIYHFRPYELKVDLYQNYAYGKDSGSDNYLTDQGVRVLYRSQFITQPANPLSSTVPASGIMANTLRYTFANVPTVQDETCIKIAYDVVLTHGQARYRYTIDTNDKANNLSEDIVSSHYYANKHKTNMQTIIDLDYTRMTNGSNVVNVSPNQVMNYWSQGYYFVEDNFNNIYQSFLQHEDYTLVRNDQNNRYSTNPGNIITSTALAYPNKYQSMAYNLRYYYIDEDRYMRAVPHYEYDGSLPADKQTYYLDYKETLYWNFTLTLNHTETPLPIEYSGSASADDRTGVYKGTNDDYLHTNNMLTITSNVYADDAQTQLLDANGYFNDPTYNYYENLKTTIDNESFLITLKQVAKSWDNTGYDVEESYNNNKYSVNGYKSTMYTGNKMTIRFVSEASATSTATMLVENIGNEYNVIVPAQGSTTIDYIPDGKYEIACHYDIDFNLFKYTFQKGLGTAELKEENGKYYIILSSVDERTTGDITHNSTIDYWRGYVNDKNTIPVYATAVRYNPKNSDWQGGYRNGFRVHENVDEKNPTYPYYDYLINNYVTP